MVKFTFTNFQEPLSVSQTKETEESATEQLYVDNIPVGLDESDNSSVLDSREKSL